VQAALKMTATGPVTSAHSGSGLDVWGVAGGDSNFSVLATDGVGAETFTYSISGGDATLLSNLA